MSTSGGSIDGLMSASASRDTMVESPTRTAAPTPRVGISVNPVVAAVLVAATLAILYGIVLRVWLLVELPIWGDEAIVGIMARAIDGGHFTAFYWGQHYGGLEPYLVALGLKVGGGGEPALNGTPALICALGAALVGVLTFATTRNRPLALAASGAVWVWPYVVIWQSVREGGFREATLCCGLAALICCVRVYRRRAGPGTLLALGAVLGLGWWASPEIGYFALPCLVLLSAWWWAVSGTRASAGQGGAEKEPSRLAAFGLVVAGGLVGSLPWLYANAHTGFASIKSGSLPANGGATYGERLSVFFHFMLPLQLGVRTVSSGAWVGGPAVGKLLYAVVLVLIAAACARAVWVAVGERSTVVPAALAAGVVTYPFLYAAAPGTAFWFDGRYGIYFPALAVALFAASLGTLHRKAPRPDDRSGTVARGALVIAAAGVVGALCLTVAGARTAGVPAGFFTSWRQGDAPMEQVVHALRLHHITDAYGDYWTAYDLDFLSGGSPAISPSPLDVVRSTGLATQVGSAEDPAWLFFAPDEAAQAGAVFGNPQPGPGPYTEQTFEAHLAALGIPYKVVKLGIMDAVLPDRRPPGL
ncbi:MAG TPA: hypothetical protein VK773_06265 [Acidimicrobiales bacterium]|jgi:hypothetical protein|nr:hypothetical protein [Acidimicrobiales bacterium]